MEISKPYILLAALSGAATGYITIHSFLAHSWTSMIFWVVVGLILLYFSNNRKTAIFAGTVFGFLDIFAWLTSGFQGASDQLNGFLLFSFGLSILGAFCGAVGALIFFWLFRRH